MERSDAEIKLLTIRQRYLDALRRVLSAKVVNLEAYRYLAAKLITCEELLRECRLYELRKRGHFTRGIK